MSSHILKKVSLLLLAIVLFSSSLYSEIPNIEPGKFTKSTATLEKSYSSALELSDSYESVIAIVAVASEFRWKTENERAESLLAHALNLAHNRENGCKKVELFARLAAEFGALGKMAVSESLIEQAFRLGNLSTSDDKCGVAGTAIAEAYRRIGNIYKAEGMLVSTLARIHQVEDPVVKSQLMSEIARSFVSINRLDIAKNIRSQALYVAVQIKDPEARINAIESIDLNVSDLRYTSRFRAIVPEK